MRLHPITDFGPELRLTPMLRYMDNVAVVSVRFLQGPVFTCGSGVRRGTFIEDTFGKQTQMQVRCTHAHPLHASTRRFGKPTQIPAPTGMAPLG